MSIKEVIYTLNNDNDEWFKQNGMYREKIELFHDFLTLLICSIEETYLGNDVVDTTDKINGHFKWCWDSTINSYKQEGIEFNSGGPHYQYFNYFFTNTFYTLEDNKMMLGNVMYNFIELFHLDTPKVIEELNIIKDIYTVLDNNIK